MDLILEKWDEILMTVKTEHDVSDISFDTWIGLLKCTALKITHYIFLFRPNR